MFQKSCKLSWKRSLCNFFSKGDFFLASNSSRSDNVVKYKTMLPFLKYVKGLLSNITILTFIFEIMQSFWAWYFIAQSSTYFSYTLSLKKCFLWWALMYPSCFPCTCNMRNDKENCSVLKQFFVQIITCVQTKVPFLLTTLLNCAALILSICLPYGFYFTALTIFATLFWPTTALVKIR